MMTDVDVDLLELDLMFSEYFDQECVKTKQRAAHARATEAWMKNWHEKLRRHGPITETTLIYEPAF